MRDVDGLYSSHPARALDAQILTKTQTEHVLLITLDSCRFDTFQRACTLTSARWAPSIKRSHLVISPRQSCSYLDGVYPWANPLQTAMAQPQGWQIDAHGQRGLCRP